MTKYIVTKQTKYGKQGYALQASAISELKVNEPKS